MNWTPFFGILVDIVVALLLIFSFIGGWRQGAVRQFFGLIAFIVALLITGLFLGPITGWLSFVNIGTWRNFLGFLLTMGIIILVIYLILWIPRNFIDKVWSGGSVWSLLGAILGLIDCFLGLALLVKLLNMYPVVSWLNNALAASHILSWITSNFGPFINALMGVFGGKTIG